MAVDTHPPVQRADEQADLVWKQWYTTRDPELDRQHQTIFELMNQLGAMIDAGVYDGEAMDTLIEKMGVEVRDHFELEEGCMARHACPMAKKNKDEHDLFQQLFNDFVRDYEQDKSPDTLTAFHEAASYWMLEHVCFIDIHLRSCIRHGI